MIRSLTTLIGIACLALGTLACSGGGSASEGGIGGTGITRGVITSTAHSATVAGTTWDDDTAIVTLDGQMGDKLDLSVGMKVRVEGTRDPDGLTGVATEVEFEGDLLGPVSAIVPDATDPTLAELTILDQTVVIEDGFTVFSGTSFATLTMGDVVEVSGYRDGDGVITATWVEFVSANPPPTPVTLEGTVTNLDTTTPVSASFEIGAITVEFDSTTPNDMLGTELPDGVPANGDFVRVTGSFDGMSTVDARSSSDRIEIEGPDQGDVSDFEVEGIVSNFVSLFDFEVDGQPVSAGSLNVQFEPLDPSFVANGALVEVEGRLQDGLLIASEVKQRSGVARISAEVAVGAIDTSAGTLTMLADPGNGIAGIEVTFDSSSRFEDTACPDFGSLAEGDFVRIRGVRIGDAQVLATDIECESGGTEIELRGRVERFDSTFQNVTILGLPIQLDGATAFEEFPAPGVSDLTGFYSFLAANPTAVLQVTDADDGDPTILDVADGVEYEGD